ncbi:MAG: hydantoinase B/oxoprolinase family protein [Steroidobacteraceae bacterium]
MEAVGPGAEDGAPDFFVASRAHHADVGGSTPGSMPPFSRGISEEGVLLADFALLERGEWQEPALRAALAAGRWPARNPQQNVADSFFCARSSRRMRGIEELQRPRASTARARSRP